MKISIPVTKERIANTITASYGGGVIYIERVCE